MASFNFKIRFISTPPVPPELNLHLDEFVEFSQHNLSSLAQEDRAFLASQGLPRDASPFLSFAAYSQAEIAERIETFALTTNLFPIGHNGSGDVIAIDKSSREVVYFNHDMYNLRVFINSSLPLFAECLCIYQEHLHNKKMHSCLMAIETIDMAAARTDGMWSAEIKQSMESD
ncbi:MAG: SUKH-4 family immunity protein [Methylophilaceae bacterium]